ncbi:hypothetical protein FHS64_001180 [Brevundimonas terrae]|jgi:hypothetical protein|nr:hypothetical protein [Brevundimonas terrae]
MGKYWKRLISVFVAGLLQAGANPWEMNRTQGFRVLNQA